MTKSRDLSSFLFLCFYLCLVFSSVHARRLRLGSHGRLESRLGYVHSSASQVDEPLKTAIGYVVWDYVLPEGKPMYHCTPSLFKDFHPKPTWFSLDIREGFKMIAQKAAFETTQEMNVYCRIVRTVRKLRLFLMERTEAQSRAKLQLHFGTKFSPDWYQTKWYAAKTSHTEHFVADFCAKSGYDGWRNPWDQDEVMLCSPINRQGHSPIKVVLEPNPVVCPSSRLKSQVGKATVEVIKTEKGVQKIQKDHTLDMAQFPSDVKYWFASFQEVAGDTNRFHFFAFNAVPTPDGNKKTWNLGLLDGPLDNIVLSDVSSQLLQSVCCYFPYGLDSVSNRLEQVSSPETQQKVTEWNNLIRKFEGPGLTAQELAEKDQRIKKYKKEINNLQDICSAGGPVPDEMLSLPVHQQ